MSRQSFSTEQITAVVREHADPNFAGDIEIVPTKRGSVAVVDTRDRRLVVKYADLSNQETEDNILPARSVGIRNEVTFLRRAPLDLAPALIASGEDDTAVYSITEYLPGWGLFTFGQDGGGRSKAVRPLLHAVKTLHDFGIIHGDITPDNAILSERAAQLLDFELAHDMGEVALAPGLYHYLSREAATAILDGESPVLDAREETFALAGTSLAMLVGKFPNVYSTSEISRLQALQEIASGRRHYNLEGVAKTDRDIAEILEEILRTPLKDRPATPLELYDEIEVYL
jgi:hypothetical protein